MSEEIPAEYFSDREVGPKPRVGQEISPGAWGGIVGVVESMIETGAFGINFPATCNDGDGIIGADRRAFALAAQADIPELEWPLVTEKRADDLFDLSPSFPFAPPTLVILDLVEFCHRNVGQPIKGHYHQYFGHHHLTFDREAGQREFKAQMNRILARNGLGYELRADGTVARLAPPVLREALAAAVFMTGDATLDQLLNEACAKFLSPNSGTRRESLEKLWDAWERMKTVANPDKKAGITALLNKASADPTFRARLELEANELTKIGNEFQIRHFETNKIPIQEDGQVDYLFHRMFSLILLLSPKR